MTQEDKQLILTDLCSRWPYEVKVKVEEVSYPVDFDIQMLCEIKNNNWYEYPKPYLRPMSLMTEEESAELSNIISEWFDKELFYLIEEPFLECALSIINYSISPKLFDWLNAHHFDYRGLIEKGLAIEVTEKNNPYKE